MQYIGQTTQELHDRMNGHRSDYNAIRTGSKKSATGDAKHQCCPEHRFENFKVMVIEVHVDKAATKESSDSDAKSTSASKKSSKRTKHTSGSKKHGKPHTKPTSASEEPLPTKPTPLDNSERQWIVELETMQPYGMNVA